MNLTIRKATEKDDIVLADLSRKTFEEAFGAENDPEDMQVYLEDSFSATQIKHALMDPETTFLMAYYQEALVGYAKIQRGPAPDCVGEDKAIRLSRLYIISDHLQKGFGYQLLQTCLDESRKRGYETMWLGVWEQNLRAQKFYERAGFVRIGTKTFVLGTDVQQDAIYALSMVKPAL